MALYNRLFEYPPDFLIGVSVDLPDSLPDRFRCHSGLFHLVLLPFRGARHVIFRISNAPCYLFDCINIRPLPQFNRLVSYMKEIIRKEHN